MISWNNGDTPKCPIIGLKPIIVSTLVSFLYCLYFEIWARTGHQDRAWRSVNKQQTPVIKRLDNKAYFIGQQFVYYSWSNSCHAYYKQTADRKLGRTQITIYWSGSVKVDLEIGIYLLTVRENGDNIRACRELFIIATLSKKTYLLIVLRKLKKMPSRR